MYWRSLKALSKIQIQITREFFKMTFTKKSRIAISYSILILAKEITIDDVPNVGNLRAVVTEILTGE